MTTVAHIPLDVLLKAEAALAGVEALLTMYPRTSSDMGHAIGRAMAARSSLNSYLSRVQANVAVTAEELA